MKSSNESNEPQQTVVETKLTKKCIKCGEVKSTTEFHKKPSNKDRLNNCCKACANESRTQHRESMPPEKYKVSRMLQAAKYRAKKKGLEFTITKDDIIVPELCPCLGVPIQLEPYIRGGKTVAHPYAPSLDRIDNNKGYTSENIWVVSHLANTIMSSVTPKELMLIAKALDARLLQVEQEKQMSLNL